MRCVISFNFTVHLGDVIPALSFHLKTVISTRFVSVLNQIHVNSEVSVEVMLRCCHSGWFLKDDFQQNLLPLLNVAENHSNMACYTNQFLMRPLLGLKSCLKILPFKI